MSAKPPPEESRRPDTPAALKVFDEGWAASSEDGDKGQQDRRRGGWLRRLLNAVKGR